MAANTTVESPVQNIQKQAGGINYAPDYQTSVLGPALQAKVSAKTEITITCRQLKEVTWLFRQSGKRKPGWLRRKFYINQYRRKELNDALLEAQLDRAFCNRYQGTEEWYDLLHLLWHRINGEPVCK